MHGPEDAAAVLEQFIHNVANLPAEINHLYQEIEANDRTIQSLRTTNQELDSAIQKVVKSNGVGAKNAKEDASSKAVLENYDKMLALEDENIALSERAEMLLQRHILKLDKKIQELQNDGSMPIDHQLPTLLRDSPGNLAPLPAERESAILALQAQNMLAARSNGSSNGRTGSSSGPSGKLAGSFTLQAQTAINNALASAGAGPGGGGTGALRTREGSATSDLKRRRGTGAGAGAGGNGAGGTAAQPAGGAPGRQGSLGPAHGSGSGTPKTSNPNSRAGSSAPGATAGRPSKKGSGQKRLGTPIGPGGSEKGWPSGTGGSGSHGGGGGGAGAKTSSAGAGATGGRRKSQKGAGTGGTSTPANGKITIRRGGAGGFKGSATPPATAHGGEDDSFMSDLDGSEDDSHIVEIRSRGHGAGSGGAVRAGASGASSGSGGAVVGGGAAHRGTIDSDRMDLDDDEGDDTKYCLCQNVSYGDMVMCDNANCRYQWFHWACIGMDKEPEGDWLCPVCVKLSPGKVQKAQ